MTTISLLLHSVVSVSLAVALGKYLHEHPLGNSRIFEHGFKLAIILFGFAWVFSMVCVIAEIGFTEILWSIFLNSRDVVLITTAFGIISMSIPLIAISLGTNFMKFYLIYRIVMWYEKFRLPFF